MPKRRSTLTIIIAATAVFGALIIAAVLKNHLPSKYDSLTACIAEKGGVMYEAYWCPACAAQKDALGSSVRKLEVVECSSPGSQTFDLCPDITNTPTWERADGERLLGAREARELAEFYDCEL
ncbi:MAG: hypothetical protein O3B64_00220 [bacterium]|nr:hypothetical protein [bacterium]